MDFSVLMSVYEKDNAEYLKTAIESIYDKQSLKPKEVVVVCDGKLTTELYSVIDEFKNSNPSIVKVVKLKENVGLGNALNEGAKECTCEYIFRMDSDDVSDPKRFEYQVNYLEKHPEIDVLGGNIEEFASSIDEENKRMRHCPLEHNDIVKMSQSRCPMNHVSVAIKKSALDEVNGYTSLLLLEDYMLWLKMINNKKVLANIDKTLVYVRVGNGFETKRGDVERKRGWKVIQKYQVKNKMIGKAKAKWNMVMVTCFVNTPPFVKKVLYKKILRKG